MTCGFAAVEGHKKHNMAVSGQELSQAAEQYLARQKDLAARELQQNISACYNNSLKLLQKHVQKAAHEYGADQVRFAFSCEDLVNARHSHQEWVNIETHTLARLNATPWSTLFPGCTVKTEQLTGKPSVMFCYPLHVHVRWGPEVRRTLSCYNNDYCSDKQQYH